MIKKKDKVIFGIDIIPVDACDLKMCYTPKTGKYVAVGIINNRGVKHLYISLKETKREMKRED